MLIPHGTERSRILEVTSFLAAPRRNRVGGDLGVAIADRLRDRLSCRAGPEFDEGAADRRNNLADELGRLNARLGALTDTINTISRHDAQIRVLAGLEPLKPEVHSAGIGGPAAPRPSWVRFRSRSRSTPTRCGSTSTRWCAAPTCCPARSARPPTAWRSHTRPDGRHAVDHADAGLAHERVPVDAGPPDPALARPHEGIDVATPMGTPIEAPAAGAVAFSGRETGYGNVIIIDHGFGIRTKYAHCSKLIVGAGRAVTRGQRSHSWATPASPPARTCTTRCMVNGQPVDPLRYVLSDSRDRRLNPHRAAEREARRNGSRRASSFRRPARC